ncbi:hypothetical protein EDB92DRAFT_1884147 [Lactarius akahatsu]|uniref:Uncharacterized protein n=1 Tax=Lactarius akahatsu TaxID=416441 RepID=A0AAD4L9Z6_9AGAM|nr:hypothetical protein EDB92DRAFT_1884147 [Lactarius akahatsu]
MPQRASIRQITRTVTYASIARLSSDITSATRRMLSPTPPHGNTKENATVWSPAVAMPITPRKGPPGPLWVTLSKARRTPDTPRKGPHHATFAYGLPSPISPPTRRLRPSAVRISRLPIPPFAVSTPPRRANAANGNHIVTSSSEYYPATPTSGRGIQYPRSSPRSPLSRKSSSIELDIAKNHCNEDEPLLSAFRGVSFSLSPSCSFSGIDNGLEPLFSSTVLQLYVAGRDVPALFSTTSPLAKMVQRAREEQSIRKGKHSQPTVGVQSVSDVTSLRVAQTTRAPVVEPQVVQVEQWPEVLPGCMGSQGLQGVGAHPSSDGHGDDAARSSEPASGHMVRARPMTRQPNERVNRPQSTPPVSLRLPADSLSVPTGIGQKFMPLMRTRSVLSRITGKAKVVTVSTPDMSLGIPGGATGEDSLVRSTGKRGETRLPQLRSMRNLFRRI